ncbi:MAG: mechanosensitive ion channel [Acidobacteria bacterium]|nr:mechanosensitive ion channel [Acidobacteriota bacterium]
MRLWSKPYFHLGNVPITPPFLIKSFVLLLIIILAARAIRRLVRYQILARTSLDIGQQYALERGIGYLVFVIGFMIVLQSIGVNLNSLIVLGGAIGIGIGLGLQTVANNFTVGIILLIERSIKVGDRVEVGSLNGDVVHIGARATWVRTNDNIDVIVPNSEFTQKPVTNWTAEDRQVRFSVPLGVSYGSDPETVRDILLNVAAEHADVLPNPKPDVIFRGFGESSLDFDLRVWTARRVQTPQILKSELYFRIFQAFRENGIEIPFPQRDLHLKSVSAPISLSPQTG